MELFKTPLKPASENDTGDITLSTTIPLFADKGLELETSVLKPFTVAD